MSDVRSTVWKVTKASAFGGEARVPPDKSISHRAVLFGAIADGDVLVDDFLLAHDTMSSVGLARALGADVEVDVSSGRLLVHGRGIDGLIEPVDIVDCGNSGSTMRMGAGIASLVDGLTVLTGDASLKRRPMARVVTPLRKMGARIQGRAGDRLAPLVIRGGRLIGCRMVLDVASAQVKSCILLAGLGASGTTTVVEPAPTRDHTERLLTYFGVKVGESGGEVSVAGGQRLTGRAVHVVGDMSSAAFLFAAAAAVPYGDVTISGLGINPTRTGFLDVLRSFGAEVEVTEVLEVSGEPSGTVRVRSGDLAGVELSGDLVVRAIDELPLVAVLATQARGRTLLRDAAELRHKETDRITTITERLVALGARIEPTPDGFVVDGPCSLTGTAVDSAGDHRVAMAMAIAGLVASGTTTISGAEASQVSYPGFAAALGALAPGCIVEEQP